MPGYPHFHPTFGGRRAPVSGRTLGACLALVAIFAPGATAATTAQEPADTPGYVHVEEFEVVPAHTEAFLEAAGRIAEAARLAELDPKFGWEVYRADNTFYVISWPESMASFDDPGAFYRAFEGTPGEGPMREAFARFEELDTSMRDMVFQERPDWSYTPESPAFAEGEHAGVFVIRNWVRFGGGETADRTAEAMMAMLAEMGTPYPVYGLESRIGEAGLVEFVVVHDGLENFHGENSLEKHLAESGFEERWAAQVAERQTVLRDTESMSAQYLAGASYTGR